ncbi:DMT family transporter [Algicella marina]|uniref:EamA family transporter n=1 Tax=Algicella marina TaxID=2683284 RepID=A0A6P1T5C3_9RHOB|nr:DMT family transporter [Algicella marina]QHQ35742.1 EamA family transporter [Algicella marina]
MTDHLKGLLITTLGVACILPDSLFVRLIEADPFVTAFWRGLSAGVIILAVILATQGPRAYTALLRTGRAGMIYTVLLATTTPAFVLAVTNTSVANVVFIFAAMPIFASIFGRLFLGEPIRRRMVLTMSAVIAGLAVIAYGSAETAIASWKGDLWALYVAAAYAAALTAVRRVRGASMVPAIPVAYIGAAVAMALLANPLPALSGQWPLFLGHGLFIAAGTCLLAIGPRYITAAEVSLLVLLESVLAPLLVWAVVGENPGRMALAGGAIVIGALLVSNLIALRNRR